MTLIEILDGLRDGRFHEGEELESDEGFRFLIGNNRQLIGYDPDGSPFLIGELITAPAGETQLGE